MAKTQFDNFIAAFRLRSGGCVRDCRCGLIYFHDDEYDWDWEDGELEKLQENSAAFGRGHSISEIDVGGITYCLECDCWHQAARDYMKFFHNYKHQIAEYFKLEKNRKQAIARMQPLLET